MQFEEQIIIAAPVHKVFALYADVKSWASWDPEVKSASIDGSFVSGSAGILAPTKGPKAKIFFTEIIPNRSFTVESKLPFCVMRFEHEISEATDNTTKVVHRISFNGLMSPFFGRVIGSQIRKGLPQTLQGLKHAVEHRG